MSTVNRPGLNALLYRVGTHGAFFETMKARLANLTLDGAGADGQTIEKFQPLLGLTTRKTGDAAIALLDSWATVGDVLTFYQERIANEGYLRTATERRSILELARLVGYKLRPGVAATVFLAYTLEDKQAEPVEIPAGARSQSIPGPDELPQSFETSDSLIARQEWNNLQVRLSRPQKITQDNALTIPRIYVTGISTNLKPGDLLLLVFGETGTSSVVRTVKKVDGQFANNRTEIQLQPVPAEIIATLPLLRELVKQINDLITDRPSRLTRIAQSRAESLLADSSLGVTSSPANWGSIIKSQSMSFQPAPAAAVETIDPPVLGVIQTFERRIAEILGQEPVVIREVETTSPSQFVPQLLRARIAQPASSLQLRRSLTQTFREGADTQAQLLVHFAPQLKDTFYDAWANASVNATKSELKSVHVLRTQAPLFGAVATDQPTYVKENEVDAEHTKGQLKPQSAWEPWLLDQDESDNALFLDQAHDEILPSSFVVIQKPVDEIMRREVHQVIGADSTQRNAYGISGKTTQLRFAEAWWTATGERKEKDISQTLRHTLVYGQSEEFTLAEEPLTDDVLVTKEDVTNGKGIVLGGLYKEFTSGRWVILSGQRADIAGVKASELLMISGLRHDFDASLPGDKMHTTLLLATQTAYSYKRDTLTIYGNVVKATHGETRNEPLGSGDGSQVFQSFELKQPPLTFVPAPTAAGAASTLKVYVNDVEWQETDTLAGAGPRDRKFITRTADDDKTTVIFGNGAEGSRLPTGVLNVKSTYRNGIGKGGNVLAEQISMLQTRPLGVKAVINPSRASGGADKESRDQARENVPVGVLSLDRLVSLQDYADFTRTFAGIAKAAAVHLSDGNRQLIHLTIAGADDIPIDPESDLYRNLMLALQQLGDLSVALRVDSRELKILVLSANISLSPGYLWEPVATEIRAALLDGFGFQKRALGQAALLCEIIRVIQNVEGVAYVDVDSFGGIPEKTNAADGTRRLLEMEEMSREVTKIVKRETIVNQKKVVLPGPPAIVPADLADFDESVLHPAQLAIFTPAVPGTIVLNQIK